jgi:nucleoside 2-deoxyribosyltransferase
MSLLYLAGPIKGCTYHDCVDWREEVAAAMPPNVICLSPMRYKSYLEGELAIAGEYERHVLSTRQAIVARDGFDVRRADLLLVNLLGAERVSIGTVWEIGVAHALNKPMVLVMEQDGSNVHDHPMVNVCAGAFHVETLDEGIQVAQAILWRA